MSVAEKYVEAFGRLAKEGTAVVVPSNVSDMGGMIASAMAVYGKISEGQRKAVSGGKVEELPSSERHRAVESSEQGHGQDVAKSVLEGFESTRARN